MEAAKVIEEIRLRPSLHALVKAKRDAGIKRPREIAEALIAAHPRLWDELAYEEQVSLLARYAQYSRQNERGHNFRGTRTVVTREDGSREAVMRIAAVGRAYWQDEWTVGENRKATRDLTVKDIEWLIRDYASRAFEMRARMKLLMAWLEYAQSLGVQRLGEIESRGLDLPSIDVPEL